MSHEHAQSRLSRGTTVGASPQTGLPPYRAQVLRMWVATTAPRPPVWRFSLEDVETGARRGFADLDALICHLLELMELPRDRASDAEAIPPPSHHQGGTG
jgi:hypothetical protein